MNLKTKIIIGLLVVLVLGTAAAIQMNRGRSGGIEVRTEAIVRRER